MTKLWIKDKLYLVDKDVAEYVEKLEETKQPDFKVIHLWDGITEGHALCGCKNGILDNFALVTCIPCLKKICENQDALIKRELSKLNSLLG